MNKQAMADDMVDAIWTLVQVKTFTQHGEYATVDEMLAVARQTADTISAFLDKAPLANELYALMSEGIIGAFAEHGAAIPPSAFFH